MSDDSNSMPPENGNKHSDPETVLKKPPHSGEMMLKSGIPNQKKASSGQPLTLPVFLLLLLGVMSGAVIYSASLSSGGEDSESEAGLRIEEVFFILERVKQDSVTIDIDILLTNIGEKSTGKINITAFAMNNQNRLVYAQGSSEIPEIKGGKTESTIISMRLDKNRSYTISIMVFEDGMLKIKGHGEVSTGELTQSAEDFTTEKNESSGGNKSESDAMGATPGFLALSVLMAIGVTAIALSLKRGGWKNE